MFKKLERKTNLNDLISGGLFYYPIKWDIINTPSGQENSWGRLIILVLDDFLPQQFLLTFGCFYYRQKLKNQQWTPWINLSLGSEAYVLPEASETSLGGVKVGRGLNISDDGVLSADSFEVPIAKKDRIGGVKIGKNLEISEGGVLSAVIPEIPEPEQKIASKTEIGGIKIGNNLNISDDGTVSVKLPDKYNLPIANETQLGGVLIGNGIEISKEGKISVNIPKPKEYVLPKATKETLGGVKVGDGINFSDDGIISIEKYELPIASKTKIGGMKITEDFLISEDGSLSINKDKLLKQNTPTKKKEVISTFEYEIQGRKYLFNYSLEDKINFANKANVCIMSQTGILAGASPSTVIEAIDIETKNKIKLILNNSEFLDLYINGALKLGA